MRNKRLGLFAIVLAVIAFCTSFVFATVSAEEVGWKVKVEDQTFDVVNSDKEEETKLKPEELYPVVTVTYNGKIVNQFNSEADAPGGKKVPISTDFILRLYNSGIGEEVTSIDLTTEDAEGKSYNLKVFATATDGQEVELASTANTFKIKVVKPKGASKVGTYILFGALILVFVGFFVWQSISNKKKRKKAETMSTGLKIGDRVKTIGGVCGFVKEINEAENTFVLETGSDQDKHCVKFDKGAIYQTAPAEGNLVAKPEDKKAKDKADGKVEEKADAPVEEKADQPAEEVKEEKPAKKSKKKEDK